jgi:POT family proton-dependent oligopeptide transporter
MNENPVVAPQHEVQQTPQHMSDRAFLGHPRGLGYLAFSEGWERFSYYGMTALLALYSAQYLFTPGHIEKIWGFTPSAICWRCSSGR